MKLIRGPILIPKLDGSVGFIRDGLMVIDDNGCIESVDEFAQSPAKDRTDIRRADGVICPPFFDNHIHIPQHPIRGHFMDDIGANPDGGRLIAGLNRNVFPAEGRCADAIYAQDCTREFLRDTLEHGVVGGAAYMTVHPAATRVALETLPASWSVGLVLMNQNCPDYLRSNEATVDKHSESLARDFGERYIVTDRFAVACDTRLRIRGVNIARRFELRTQTHLNEQLKEKRLVEDVLYVGKSYTDVYKEDGLLEGGGAILAHCIHMTDAELDTLAQTRSVVAHCPVSNTLLGSGIMPLDRIVERGIDYAICTDVGASPTTSLLNEMAQFLKVHAARSKRVTPSEALFRTTLAATRMMNLDSKFGRLEKGFPASFIEIACDPQRLASCQSVGDVIRSAILEMSSDANQLADALRTLSTGEADAGAHIDLLSADVSATVKRLDHKVRRVTIDGATAFERQPAV